MLNRDALIKRLMTKHEAEKHGPGAVQAERQRLHALRLDALGKEFEKAFPTEDSYELKSVA